MCTTIHWMAIIAYFVVGLILANKWFDDEYEEEYKQLRKTGEVETPMATLLILFMVVFWPIKLVYNFIKHSKV